MNRLKIFLTTLTMVVVSCVTCFADSSNGKEYKYNITYGSNSYYFDSISVETYENDDTMGLFVFKECKYYAPNGSSEIKTNYRVIMPKRSVMTNCPFVQEFLNGTNNGGDFPQLITPVDQMGIQEIVPHFWGQLKNYLPTGIMILSVLLGVQLVPRLIRFLM